MSETPLDNSDFEAVAEFLGTHELEFMFSDEFGGKVTYTTEAIRNGHKVENDVELVRFYLKQDGTVENYIHPDAEVSYNGNRYLVRDVSVVHEKLQIVIVRHIREGGTNGNNKEN